jgi:hypothetical protein
MPLLTIFLGWVAASVLLVGLLVGINRLAGRGSRREAEIRMHEVRRELELNQLGYEVRADAARVQAEIDRELRERGL